MSDGSLRLDGVVPVIDLHREGDEIAIYLDTSIGGIANGSACQYRFETGDPVTIDGPETHIEGEIRTAQIEHGLTLWVDPDAGVRHE